MIGWRTPDFWWEPIPTLAARLLKPFGDAYGAETAGRMQRRGVKFEIPVITIGAFALGGPGKTPTVETIVRLLIAAGEQPAILSRGYGGAAAKQRAPRFVNPAKHGARDVGDEPLLLSRAAPVIVGADRVEAGWLARRAVNPSVLVLDDGLQSRQIEPDLAIAVVDGGVGIGNGLCVPAGPLRAPLAAQMRHVDAVLIVGHGARGGDVARMAAARGKSVFTARLAPKLGQAERFAGKPIVAFAGIGRPQKFSAMLEQVGADIRAWHSFADHHVYTTREVAALMEEARRLNAQLVTTEKDLVRLQTPHPPEPHGGVSKDGQTQRPLPPFETRSYGVDALAVELVFDEPEAIASLLRSALPAACAPTA
ncbi:MAG: tetraacyldisaccharide 4-kinase [Methylobacteriaceae bacterium]|jgi:tetraacyldisaccharide 4'-kinase|nr:tetraacyldisaccharide 4-kinase [Methylobacteriaceae bacterium]